MSNKKSNYWKDMFIQRKKEHTQDTEDIKDSISREIVSTSEPIDFGEKYSKQLAFECHYPYTQQTHNTVNEMVVDFINKNNQMYTGIYELVTPTLFETFTNIPTYLGIVKYIKTGKIMGVMFAVALNTTVISTTKFALTSYLCVHKKLRGKGICMMLIRKLLKQAHSNRMLCSYYLQEKPFSGCALKVSRWMRPINPSSAIKKGFEFVMPPKKDTIKYKHAYRIPNNLSNGLVFTIVSTNKQLKKSLEFIAQFNNTSKNKNIFSWKPTKREWKSWCKSETFDTLMIHNDNEQIIGVITVQKKQIYIPETQCTANLTFIPYAICTIGNIHRASDILKAAIIHSKNIGVDMLFAFESGPFTKQTFQENNAVPTGEMYIDFYNFNNKYNTKDIFIPLL